jgi:hypothetical protein
MKLKYTKIVFFILAFLVLIIIIILKKTNTEYFENIWVSGNEYVSIDGSTKETCLSCHQNTKGYSKYHNPELIGCSSCHLGNINATDKDESHKGMILIPGNLADAKETCGKCHSSELHKIENSLMTTNSGIVAVNKFVFGESDSLNSQYHIKDIKNSPADKHLRDLCTNCHLGAEKKDFGEINQFSRGGGCNACHLNYTEGSKTDLALYLDSDKKILPKIHPSTDIFVKNEHCFGCHSRSSRISTNYEGWQETLMSINEIDNQQNYRIIENNRVYKYNEEDIHHTNGLLCIDCHSSHEVMGDGKTYSHAEQAVKIQCIDCHFKDTPNTTSYDSLDAESQLVFLHREYKHTDKNILVAKKDGHPLVNTFIDSLKNAFLISKKDSSLHKLNPQSEICSRDNAHKNVSCSMCHSSWAPKCIGCHNEFDKNETNGFDLLDKAYIKGQWKEYISEFSSSLPTMGVRNNKGNKTIEPAIPGMIMTIDLSSYTEKIIGKSISFHRLYAPNSPHTTSKNVRSCISCHANSAAIGYGSGKLNYTITNDIGRWTFIPEYEINDNDKLPEDAWIPYLKPIDKDKTNSTRSNFRPFTLNEQKQLLLVGTCLQCHKGNSNIMQESLINGIKPLLEKLDKKCILPTWN